MVGYAPVSRNDQFSAYDERPDPKGPGQQGVLFRKVAPAQDQETRNHNAPVANKYRGVSRVRSDDPGTQQGALFGSDGPVQHSTVPVRGAGDYLVERKTERADPRLAKGRATGMVPEELYHGTSARLKPGSLIKPGKPGNFDASPHGQTLDVNHENVFATSNLPEAYRFSRIAQEKKQNEQEAGMTASITPRRAHVYRVQATGSLATDAEDEDTRAGYNTYEGETRAAGEFQSKQPLRVLSEVQFSDAKEAYRSEMEDENGMEPGSYEYSEKTHEQRYGW